MNLRLSKFSLDLKKENIVVVMIHQQEEISLE